MTAPFPFCVRRLLGMWLLLLLPLLGHGQAKVPAPTGQAVLTGRVSGPTTDSVAVSLRENPLDPVEKLFRIRLSEKGEFRLVVPVSGPTKADLVYGDDVAPLFLDPGTDLNVRFKGADMAGTLRFRANDVPTGFATKLRNRANLTEEQRHREQAANANNYLIEADEQFVENDGFQVLPDNISSTKPRFFPFWNTAASTNTSFWRTTRPNSPSRRSSTTTPTPKWCTPTPTISSPSRTCASRW